MYRLLNALTSLTVLSLISINIPGAANIFNKAVLDFSQLDILPTNVIFPAIFSFDDNTDGPMNQNFNIGGYQSKNALKNMQSTFIFLCCYVFLLFVLFLLDALKRINVYGSVSMKVQKWLEEALLWNGVLRFIVQQYSTLLLSCWINFYYVSVHN